MLCLHFDVLLELVYIALITRVKMSISGQMEKENERCTRIFIKKIRVKMFL